MEGLPLLPALAFQLLVSPPSPRLPLYTSFHTSRPLARPSYPIDYPTSRRHRTLICVPPFPLPPSRLKPEAHAPARHLHKRHTPSTFMKSLYSSAHRVLASRNYTHKMYPTTTDPAARWYKRSFYADTAKRDASSSSWPPALRSNTIIRHT